MQSPPLFTKRSHPNVSLPPRAHHHNRPHSAAPTYTVNPKVRNPTGDFRDHLRHNQRVKNSPYLEGIEVKVRTVPKKSSVTDSQASERLETKPQMPRSMIGQRRYEQDLVKRARAYMAAKYNSPIQSPKTLEQQTRKVRPSSATLPAMVTRPSQLNSRPTGTGFSKPPLHQNVPKNRNLLRPKSAGKNVIYPNSKTSLISVRRRSSLGKHVNPTQIPQVLMPMRKSDV